MKTGQKFYAWNVNVEEDTDEFEEGADNWILCDTLEDAVMDTEDGTYILELTVTARYKLESKPKAVKLEDTPKKGKK